MDARSIFVWALVGSATGTVLVLVTAGAMLWFGLGR